MNRHCDNCDASGINVLPIRDGEFLCDRCAIEKYAQTESFVLLAFVASNMARQTVNICENLIYVEQFIVSSKDMMVHRESIDTDNCPPQAYLNMLPLLEQLSVTLASIIAKSIEYPVKSGYYAEHFGISQQEAESKVEMLQNQLLNLNKRHGVMEKLLRAIE